MNNVSKYHIFSLAVILTTLMLLMFLLVGCGGSEPNQELSSDAPRSNTPIYPGAELVYESFFSAAVYEVYATDASIDDVVQFYSEYPEFESVSDNVSPFGSHEGGFLDTELFSLLFDGESDEVVQDEIEKSGRLIRFMIAPSDAQVIDALIAKEITPELEPDNTIIVIGVYTK